MKKGKRAGGVLGAGSMLMVLGAGSVWCGVGEGEGGRRHGASVTGLLSSLIYWTVGMWSSFAPICQPVSRLDDNDDDDGMLWRLTVHPDASARTTRLHLPAELGHLA